MTVVLGAFGLVISVDSPISLGLCLFYDPVQPYAPSTIRI